ncbi:MAG: hypothetical protein KY459_03220 [Acidobacteria bacterium]|nr:hypothetical protein [Acidobacteriota bacterium]
MRTVIGRLGELFIYTLIFIFGRRHRRDQVEWLVGPMGEEQIGDRPYEKIARDENLTLERAARRGGLIPDLETLRSKSFDPDQVDWRIRDFYENTASYQLDTWATTHFPARIALWLLVTTISARVDQLNFPLDGLDTARGMTSEIILLRDEKGKVRYTGWYRRLVRLDRAIYTGFYMIQPIPAGDQPCVKVVFPMPRGNATVLLRPENEGAELRLISAGSYFGDAGFYRVQQAGDRLRIWRVPTLRERFHLYIDSEDLVRCDHTVRFLGMPVLTLHYRIRPGA